MKSISIGDYTLFPYGGLPYEEWLKIRNNMGVALGGSDVSCVLNQNPYCSASQLFDEKLKLTPPVNLEGNKAVFFGNAFEDVLLDKSQYYDHTVQDSYLTNHKKLRIHNAFPYTMQHKDMPFMFANVDGIGVDFNNKDGLDTLRKWTMFEKEMPIPDYIIEIKTMSGLVRKKWAHTNGLPIGYLSQVLAYMIQWMPVNPDIEGLLFALVDGTEFYAYHIVYKQELIDDIIEKCYLYHQKLLKGVDVIRNATNSYQQAQGLSEIRPDPDGSDSLDKHLRDYLLNNVSVDKVAAGESHHTQMAIDYLKAHEREKEARADKQLISNMLKDELRAADVAQLNLENDAGMVRFNKRLTVKVNGV